MTLTVAERARAPIIGPRYGLPWYFARRRLEQSRNRFSRHPRQSIPDAARESRIAVGGASAMLDVAQALEFCEGQCRVNRPEFVCMFVDRAIHKQLPVPAATRILIVDCVMAYEDWALHSAR
jgi:hypothetical protein